jgi:hypothetical protein
VHAHKQKFKVIETTAKSVREGSYVIFGFGFRSLSSNMGFSIGIIWDIFCLLVFFLLKETFNWPTESHFVPEF